MPRKSRKNVGLIGLGIIGTRVAATLRAAGCHVFVWSRTPKAVPNFLGSAAEVAEICEVIQLFVSDAQAVIDTIESIGDVLTSNHVIVNCATIGPEATQEAARLVQEKGAAFLDCPFTGSKVAAEKGQLCYYVGGDDAAFQRVKPILEAASRAIVRCGKVGDAATLKVATNLITAVTTQTLAEALAIVQKSGIAPEVFAAAIEQNACKSGVIELKLPKMVRGDFDPHFSLKHMFKDVQLGIHIANSFDLEVPVTTVTAGVMYGALNNGWADMDFSSIFRIYADTRQPDKEVAALPQAAAESERLEAKSETKPDIVLEAQVVESKTAEPEAKEIEATPVSEAAKEISPPFAEAQKREGEVIPELVTGDIFKRRRSEEPTAEPVKTEAPKIIDLEPEPASESQQAVQETPKEKSGPEADIPEVIFGRVVPFSEKKDESAEARPDVEFKPDEAKADPTMAELERTLLAPPPLPSAEAAADAAQAKGDESPVSRNGEAQEKDLPSTAKPEDVAAEKSSNGVEVATAENPTTEEPSRFRPLQRIRRFFSAAGK